MIVFVLVSLDGLILVTKSIFQIIKLYKLSLDQRPIITIHDTHVTYGIKGNFTSILFEDLDSVELEKRVFFKGLFFNFNKEMKYQRSFYEKLKLMGKKSHKTWSWPITGFTVDPKELELSLNHYMEAYKAKNRTVEV